MNYSPLYIVTLNYNLWEDTITCVDSVLSARINQNQIVIVDNGSTDDSVAKLQERYGSSMKIICNKENLGFAAGMNFGIRWALEENAMSVLILNNDTIIESNMIDRLLDIANQTNTAGILAPAIYYYDEPEKIWRLGDIRYRWLPMPLQVKKNKHLAEKNPFRVDYVTGCGMLVKREVFEEIGLFDDHYFMYFEDADFCRRALDRGFSVWCVPKARMWHKVSLTARQDKPKNRYYRFWSMIRFYHDHPHGPFTLLREVYIILKIVKTIFIDLILRDWNLIWPLLSGSYDGFKYCFNQKQEATSVPEKVEYSKSLKFLINKKRKTRIKKDIE